MSEKLEPLHGGAEMARDEDRGARRGRAVKTRDDEDPDAVEIGTGGEIWRRACLSMDFMGLWMRPSQCRFCLSQAGAMALCPTHWQRCPTAVNALEGSTLAAGTALPNCRVGIAMGLPTAITLPGNDGQ